MLKTLTERFCSEKSVTSGLLLNDELQTRMIFSIKSNHKQRGSVQWRDEDLRNLHQRTRIHCLLHLLPTAIRSESATT